MNRSFSDLFDNVGSPLYAMLGLNFLLNPVVYIIMVAGYDVVHNCVMINSKRNLAAINHF